MGVIERRRQLYQESAAQHAAACAEAQKAQAREVSDAPSAVARAGAVVELTRLAERADRLEAEKTTAYWERNLVVSALCRAAIMDGCKAWLGRHPETDQEWDRDWMTIVFIALPDGQVSWHIHRSEVASFWFLPMGGPEWDGHDTAEKYRRLEAWHAMKPGNP